MRIWRLFWSMITFRPWLFGINCAAITLLFINELIPGLVAREFFNRLPAAGQADIGLWWLVALLLMSAAGRVVFLFGLALTNMPFILTNAALLQKNIFQHLLRLPAGRALPSSPGEALSRFRDDVDGVTLSMLLFNDFVASTIFAIIALVVMVIINATITAAVFLPLTLVVAVVYIARTRIEGYRRANRVATGEVTSFLAEIFGAAQAVQVANANESVAARFRHLSATRLRAAVRDRVFDQVLQSIFWNTVSVGTGLTLLVAGQAMSAGQFTVGDFALFVYFLGWMTEFIALCGMTLARYRQGNVAFGRMTELLGGAPPVALVEHGPVYLTGSLPPAPGIPARQREPLNELEVIDLTYRYPGSERGIGPLSFRLERGSFTVITGRVGAGKTTLLQTVLGLLPKDGGAIRWNGIPIEDPASFFAPPHSAYTAQAPRLFSDTLRDNILLGLPSDELNLAGALRLAVLETDVASMPRGLDTLVGARGVRLSGGQVQRAAAARMFVRGADLLVFDDLSSALDVETERMLWERVFARSGATVLAVSHRRAALQRADQIIVLNEGQIETSGTLAEALVRSPEMRRLWRARARDEVETKPPASSVAVPAGDA